MIAKKHICHLVYGFHVGGLEKIIVNCINELGDQYQHTIVVLTQAGDLVEELPSSVTVIEMNKKAGNDLSIHWRLFRLLLDLKPDVFHSYNLGTIEYQWVAWLAKVPKRIHAEHGRDTYDPHGKVAKYRYLRQISSLIIHKVVAVSQDLYRWLQCDVGINETKLVLITNGVDVDYFSPYFKKTNLAKFTVGHVARLQGIKNQELLINAFQQACRQDCDFSRLAELILVGSGDELQVLKALSNADPLSAKKIVFAGRQQSVRDYYSRFDVFAMSSIAEGIPVTLLESMAMGVPHVVTRVGGIKEVILEGETGLGVESQDQNSLADGLLILFHDRALREAMGLLSRARVEEHFSQRVMVGAYADLYHQGA
ncbi:glycosyltransferase [Photobacterium chitinilyticum]|uniref:Glycosyltransferase n=1 Tax=Photobacterium chitinilyticum TaxID=2485123 RepID=A0A444JSH4_9GAMM|nr:glycosyltransferase [Photobacterium chitinilyticum]RWX56075.1 glycosyltransferase [Photobacterium chitinilyticum]